MTVTAIQPQKGQMTFGQGFFDLQFRFASRVVALSGLPLGQVLLDYTNLYIRFGLGREFDRNDPAWLEYLAGLQDSTDGGAWTYRFFLSRPHDVQPPSVVAAFGCFSYAKLREDYIRLHFQNCEAKEYSPLSVERLAVRLAELRALFQHVRHTQREPLHVAGLSWMYNLAGYRRFFPATYLASATEASPRFRNMPLWGQFLDRHGPVRRDPAAIFLERLSRQASLAGIERCFPLQALAVEAPVSDFYAFHNL